MHHDLTEESLQKQLEEAQKRIAELERLVDTSRLKAEEKLQGGERLIRTLFDSSSQPMLVIDQSGTTLSINTAAANRLGHEAPEILGHSVYDLLPPDVAKTREAFAQEVFRTGKGVRFEDQVEGKWFENKGYPIPDASGKITRIVIFADDITERKQMEKALRSSEETARAILNAPDEVIFLIDAAGLVLEANAAAQRRLGANIIGHCVHDLIAPEKVAQARKTYLEQVVTTGRPVSFEDERIGRTFHTVLYPICDEAGQVTQVVVYAADISEHKGMEEELRRSHDELELRVKERTREVVQLAAAVENTIDGIALCDGYEIVYANLAFERITGYPLEELIGKDVMMLRSQAKPISHYDEMRESLSKRRIWTGVYPAKKKDGTTIYAETHASLIRDSSTLVVICHDITDKLRLEEELRQAHKMEAIGTLAGGVAHDFNNILAAVLGFGEIALEDTEQAHVEDSLKQVISAALRGRDLVRQILTFSRKTTQEKKTIDLAPVIRESLNLLRATLPSTINTNLSMNAENYTTKADLNGIQQIMLNLCTNAAQAMPHGGMLSVSVTDTKFTSRRLLPDPELKIGQYLVLSFTDNGTGMDKTVLNRIFEPFFATKTSGQGTGMGLAVVYGIVKDHGGAITVESSPGKGSTFVVYLPLIHETAKEEALAVEPALTGGHERVLFVDDEENITAIAQQMLARLGYDVVTIGRPEQALELFGADPHAFDLVITDQTMPNFTGLSLAKKLLTLRGDIPIILATGYSEAVSAEKARKAGIREFLMKPMQKREWAETIRRVLDAPASESAT